MAPLTDLLFGRKLHDDEYIPQLREAITHFMRFTRTLATDTQDLGSSPERMRNLAHELDTEVRDGLERMKPMNHKYARFHTALRRLVRIRSMQAHDTAKFIADPLRHSGIPRRTQELAALAAEQVESMLNELRAMGDEEMQRLLGEQLIQDMMGLAST